MLRPVDHVVGGVRCAVHDSDPAGREAVVFVHGNPGPMDDREELAPAAGAFARVVAMDMPGYGRAEHPRRFDYTIGGVRPLPRGAARPPVRRTRPPRVARLRRPVGAAVGR